MLENCKLRFRYLLTSGELIDTAVRELDDHKIVAWMQGRMEFGPRALGNRSILASPLNPYSTENLNIYIKHREPFRKFAASVPAEVWFRVLRGRPERAVPGHRRPRPPRAPRHVRERDPGPRPGARPHRLAKRTIPCTGACCTRPESPPACRCSTTPPSTCSATRWSAPPATPSAASTPPASTPCSWAISCCRSRGARHAAERFEPFSSVLAPWFRARRAAPPSPTGR